MNTITLFASPGACSLVTMIAMETAGADYQITPVVLSEGMHKQPAYLNVNPKGKVPALRLNGQVITETPAILTALNLHYPAAGLLPQNRSQAEILADLCFVASGVHPLVTRFCKPELIASEAASETIKNRAETELNRLFELVNQRLKSQSWWYGENWSAIDGYWFWVLQRLSRCQFGLAAFETIQRHYQANLSLPAVQQALEREKTM